MILLILEKKRLQELRRNQNLWKEEKYQEDFHPAYPPRPVEKKPEKLPYGAKKEEIKIDSYGTYEKKETKKTFHPSPVISPIYGLIDSGEKKKKFRQRRKLE